MDQKRKKDKKWWQYLLVIPVMAAADVLALLAAGMADTALAGDGPGHPAPAFFLAALVICGVLTVVLTLRALILCLRTVIRTRRGTGTEEPACKQSTAPEYTKKVWHCFIPLMIEIPLALISVIFCGYWEISSFYNNPNHVGFAFPVTTFLLAGICLLVTVVIGLICTIAAVIRSRKNSKS